MRRTRLRIYGYVQGVGFRLAAYRRALTLGLGGSARNESDGSVTIVVEGRADSVEEFIDWARRGPSDAEVERVDQTEETPSGEREFRVG